MQVGLPLRHDAHRHGPHGRLQDVAHGPAIALKGEGPRAGVRVFAAGGGIEAS